MELAFTHEEKTLKRKYRHFSITSKTTTTEIEEKKKADFFYIGRKTSSIDCLIKSFETGYAAENTENAKFILSRLTAQESTIPGVFIVDASMDKKEIAEIFSFVSNIVNMSTIPFIVDAAHASAADLASIRKMEFVDEILFLNDYNSQHLFGKISFLKKIKQKAASLHVKNNIETSINGSVHFEING